LLNLVSFASSKRDLAETKGQLGLTEAAASLNRLLLLQNLVLWEKKNLRLTTHHLLKE
jgi:hypothetical protein